jgi:Kdo2-lipid IVA lauroyltransferase/acyltransferase
MPLDWLREPPDGALTGALRWWRPALQSLQAPPLPLALELARCYLRLATRIMPRRRKRTIRGLELAGYDSKRMEAAVIRSVARFYAVFARFPDLTKERLSALVRIEGEEHYREAKARGRGVLVASGHIGHWELGAHVSALSGEPMNLVIRTYPDQAYETLAARYRTLSGNRLIAQEGAAFNIAAALRRKEAVAMLIDANVPPPGDMGVDFLGAKVRASTALARMAACTGAAVIPSFTLWSEERRRFIARTHSPFPITGDAREDTRRLYALLEAEVRRHPDQWFWIFDPCWARPNGE